MTYSEKQWALRMDWDQTGWCRFLPWEGALLWRIFCEASERDVAGNLQELVDWYAFVDPVATDERFFAGLDSPIEHRRSWSDRRRLARLFNRAGLAYPQTARQTAGIGVELGLYTRLTDPERWRVPNALPLPTEILPMTERQRRLEDGHRHHLLWSEPAAAIVEVLREVGCPEQVNTSVEELADLICEAPETVRQSLAFLNDTRFSGYLGRPMMRMMMLDAAGNHVVADPERLEEAQELELIPNWPGLMAAYGSVWGLSDET